jgi:hypothetical protein
MTTKVVNVFKYLGLFLAVFMIILSCEKEIVTVGVNLVDTDKFSTDILLSEVVAATENIDRVPTNQVGQYLFGVYSDPEFGKMEATIVSQLSLLNEGFYNYGENAAIDSVIVDIPYEATEIGNDDQGRPQFTLDSIIGNTTVEFQVNVFELKTFLNTLNPEDPSKNAVYYSNKEYLKGDVPLYSGMFKANANDTVAYIKRRNLDGTIFTTDTIKKENIAPSIKLPLNKNMIKEIFLDNAENAEFSDLDNFIHYFRGLYIEAKGINANNSSHLMPLAMESSTMTIYYSNDTDEGPDQDLNGNGTTGEQDIRGKGFYEFPLGPIVANAFVRDRSNNHQSGEDRLYIQGTDGSLATIDLFVNEDLIELQSKNWLTTNASLIFYIDQNASSNIIPERLYLYNIEEGIQVRDVITEGSAGGILERDEEGNPYRYVFNITDYLSELLKSSEGVELKQLGVKVFNSIYIPQAADDIFIEEENWDPKGVVLYGSSISAGDKRVKLELSYTEINN